MATVRDILAGKDTAVHTIDENMSVLEATQLMNRHQIGALIVAGGGDGEKVLGIFTERDVLRRVVAEQRDPAATRVGDVMTDRVVCCTADQPIDEARSIMKQRRVRHLPVVDGENGPIGVISIGDLNAWSIQDGEVKIQYMEDYIYGRV